MRWVKDRTNRFDQRPHYEAAELDHDCELIVSDFLRKRYGNVEYPLSTGDLTVLLEQWVDDLDMGADLSTEEGEVEGVTEFRRGSKPVVRISEVLTNNPRMENRLRTTLTHEFGHVRFHGFMFEVQAKPMSLFEDNGHSHSEHANKCKRDSILGATERDWMEWQAGYACGAFLMPHTALVRVVRDFREKHRLRYEALSTESAEGVALVETVSTAFHTSKDAARVRLSQKKMLSEGATNGGLF